MSDEIVCMTRKEVCLAIPCSDRKLGYMLAKNQFPPPVRMGKLDYWSAKALAQWRASKFVAQENWRPSHAR